MIPLHKVFMPDDISEVIEPLRRTLQSGWIGEGERVLELEALLRGFLGAPHVSLLNSCTSAIELALRVAGVGIGDEVITTAMTCIATNEPIVLAGATPVWADVDPETGNISAASIRSRIRRRTRAIIVVHWGGYPCEMDEILEVAREHGLPVIEDCAHALGSVYRGRHIGSHGDFCCFSLGAIKHISTGDGGILTCRRSEDHARVRSLRWFGIDRERRVVTPLGVADWDIVEAGYKFHMNDLAATIGLAVFPHLERLLAARAENASHYRRAFAGLRRVRLLREDADRRSAYWLFTLRVDDQVAFIRHMQAQGIAASIVHARNDSHTLFSNYGNRHLVGLDEFAREMVCIPVGHWVGPAERKQITNAVCSEAW